MATKEIVHAFKWHRAFAKLKASPKEVDPLSRYTNFTLGHVWEKLMKRNPELFDPELDLMHSVRPSLAKPECSPLGN